MANPPVLRGSYWGGPSATNPVAQNASITVNSGDYLVCIVLTSDSLRTASAPAISGFTVDAWTLKQSWVGHTNTANAYIYTAKATSSSTTGTLSVTGSGGNAGA